MQATKHNRHHDGSSNASSDRTQAEGEQAGHKVDVQDAERAFEDLRRELSRASSLHRTRTGQRDEEKGRDEDDFDLAEYLSSSLAERDAAGFKRKVVGTTWTDLRVTGAGGMKVSFPWYSTARWEIARPSRARAAGEGRHRGGPSGLEIADVRSRSRVACCLQIFM